MTTPSDWTLTNLDGTFASSITSWNTTGLAICGRDTTNNTVVWTSTDGSAWSTPTTLFGGTFASSITIWHTNRLAVCGNNADYPIISDAVVWTSIDGSSWTTPRTISVGNNANSITDWNITGLAVCGFDRTTGNTLVWTSVDGSTWSPPTTLIRGTFGGSITSWNTTGLAICGNDNANNTALVWTSTDGSTWSTPKTLLGGLSGNSITSWNTTGLAICGKDTTYNTVVWTSTDGSTWSTPTTLNSDAGSAVSITSWNTNGLAVCGRNNGGNESVVWTSTDGSAWSTPTTLFGGLYGGSITSWNTTGLAICGNDTTYNAAVWTYSPPYPCFKSGSKILTNQGYKLIEELKKGDLVKTLKHELKAIDLIGKRDIFHPASEDRIKEQLYKCTKEEYPEVFEDLVITGCHSILVDKFASEEQRNRTIEVNGDTYVTDRKYRLPACADERASIYDKKGSYTIYHLALEHDDYYMNYGIYANGLLVETCSKRYLNELSNMELIE